MARYEGPRDKAEEDSQLQQVCRRHHSPAEPRAQIVNRAEDYEDSEGKKSSSSRRDSDDGLDVGDGSEGKRGGDAGIDDCGGHPSIKEGDARTVPFAQVDIFASGERV